MSDETAQAEAAEPIGSAPPSETAPEQVAASIASHGAVLLSAQAAEKAVVESQNSEGLS